MKLALLGVALLMAAPGVRAQDAIDFEGASIKVRVGAGAFVPSSPDRYNRTAVSLTDLIRDAYRVQNYQVVGGPEWARGSVRFDVMAKASFVPSRDQMVTMVQRLLAERFALRVHRDTRELPVYALSLGRDDGRLGKQIARSTVDCAATKLTTARMGDTIPAGPQRPDGRPACGEQQSADPRGTGGLMIRYQGGGVTLGEFAAFLSQFAGRTIVDRTGLAGDFDIDLSFHLSASFAGAPVEAISYFTAVQEQLGLKLDSTKGPVEVIVIDSAEMPTPD